MSWSATCRSTLRALVPALVLGTWAIVVQEVVPAAQSARRTVWDSVYTEAQAKKGMAAYQEQCSFCHLADLSGEGFAPALIEDTFKSRWQDGNLADLFIIVKQTMPQDKPASLGDQEYADIVAFLLKSNKYPAGEKPLEPDPLALKGVGFKQ